MAKLIGKGLSNTQTSTGGGAPRPSGMTRGKRMDPVSGGAQMFGRGLSNTKTRNSLTCKR